ncbi:hypothetical protein [Haloarchaeobius sp. FL176]|uniref:hypothetical protein n=1 Tax=Haloarchaeobius sp. FL176 TaxID=2967129 RepID=UPI002147BBCD|nr:hypothetical protein [Haloarchaeobius sp. FL176]
MAAVIGAGSAAFAGKAVGCGRAGWLAVAGLGWSVPILSAVALGQVLVGDDRAE